MPKPQKTPSAFRCLSQSLDGSDVKQGTHPSDSNGVQLRQTLRRRQALMDQDGVDDFILKTTSIPCLVSRLRAHIRRREQGLNKRTDPETVSM